MALFGTQIGLIDGGAKFEAVTELHSCQRWPLYLLTSLLLALGKLVEGQSVTIGDTLQASVFKLSINCCSTAHLTDRYALLL